MMLGEGFKCFPACRKTLEIADFSSIIGLLGLTQGEDTTTAMARALVDGLETEGIEEMWSKLNQTSRADYGKRQFEDVLSCLDTDTRRARKQTDAEHKAGLYSGTQLLLFENL
jgi:hypothetical protein